MSTVKCEVCGRPLTHCPACYSQIPSFSEQKKDTNFKFPSLPIIEVESPSLPNQQDSNAQNRDYGTSLPVNEQTVIHGDINPSLSHYFDEDAPICNCVRDADGNPMPNPNINRASITPTSYDSPYSPKKVQGSHGDYNVAELAKIAVDQQIKAERRKRRRNRWIRRAIVLCVLVFIILYNWDFVYYACRTFLNGIDAVFQIFGLLGEL